MTVFAPRDCISRHTILRLVSDVGCLFIWTTLVNVTLVCAVQWRGHQHGREVAFLERNKFRVRYQTLHASDIFYHAI